MRAFLPVLLDSCNLEHSSGVRRPSSHSSGVRRPLSQCSVCIGLHSLACLPFSNMCYAAEEGHVYNGLRQNFSVSVTQRGNTLVHGTTNTEPERKRSNAAQSVRPRRRSITRARTVRSRRKPTPSPARARRASRPCPSKAGPGDPAVGPKGCVSVIGC